MRRCVARVGNEVPRMTFLFFLFSSARLFLLASRSFRQSTLASKFRATDPGLRIPLPTRAAPPSHRRRTWRTIQPVLLSDRWKFLKTRDMHSPMHLIFLLHSSFSSYSLPENSVQNIVPFVPAEFLRFFLLTPPCLGFWGFLVTTLSLGGIDRYNKINFPFSLVHPSTHGPKETEGSKFSSTSVIIRPGSNFRPVVGQAVSLFPPRSNSGGTIS